jgi:hypothetical protein
MSQEMEYPTLLSSHPDAFANTKYPTFLSSHQHYREDWLKTKHPDGDTGATMTKVGDTGATGAVEDTWSNQILGGTTTTAAKSKTADAASVRVPIVHPDDVHRLLRMNDLVRSVKKAWAPKSRRRLLEEVLPARSCKDELDTITCCSLGGMKKLFSGLRLPWARPCASPSDAPLELSVKDLHMLKTVEKATGKPWYRQSYSSFPKPKAHVAKKCATQSLTTCHVTEQQQKSMPCSEPVTGIKLRSIEHRHSAPHSLISWQ